MLALEFELAISHRLRIYDKEQMRANAKVIAIMANKCFMGEPLIFEDEGSSSAERW